MSDELSCPKKEDHWSDMAKQWDRIGPPLRPSEQDVAFYTEAVERWARSHGAPRALILGVTPELFRLSWPRGTSVTAVDHTQEMIDAVWPGPRETAVCGDWKDLPMEPASCDIVLCDGGLHLSPYPDGQREVVRNLRRVVAPGGVCVFRFFVPPPRRESPETVLQDLLAAKISSLNVLKLRLGMAMQTDAVQGIQLAQVWDAVHRVAPDWDRLAERIHWSIQHLRAFDTYRNCLKRYHFGDSAEVRDLFCKNPGGFEVETLHIPTYEWGESCPTVAFRRVLSASDDR